MLSAGQRLCRFDDLSGAIAELAFDLVSVRDEETIRLLLNVSGMVRVMRVGLAASNRSAGAEIVRTAEELIAGMRSSLKRHFPETRH